MTVVVKNLRPQLPGAAGLRRGPLLPFVLLHQSSHTPVWILNLLIHAAVPKVRGHQQRRRCQSFRSTQQVLIDGHSMSATGKKMNKGKAPALKDTWNLVGKRDTKTNNFTNLCNTSGSCSLSRHTTAKVFPATTLQDSLAFRIHSRERLPQMNWSTAPIYLPVKKTLCQRHIFKIWGTRAKKKKKNKKTKYAYIIPLLSSNCKINISKGKGFSRLECLPAPTSTPCSLLHYGAV